MTNSTFSLTNKETRNFSFWKTILATFLIGTAFSLSTFAQVTQDDIGVIQSLYGKDKRELVKHYMNLSGKQDTAFWKLYDAYENERKEIGTQRIKVLEDYANNYVSLTDEKADQLISQAMGLSASVIKVQQKYYKKLKKEIGALKAAQFIQLEMYMDNAVRNAVISHVPFIGEMDRK